MRVVCDGGWPRAVGFRLDGLDVRQARKACAGVASSLDRTSCGSPLKGGIGMFVSRIISCEQHESLR